MSSQPQSRPVAPQDRERIRSGVRLFLVLILGLLVCMPLDLPFRLAGAVLAVAALVVGFRVLRRLRALRRAGTRPPGGVVVATGMVLAVIMLFTLLSDALYYPLVSDLERCRADALTQTAKDACDRDARDRLDNLIDRLERQARSSGG